MRPHRIDRLIYLEFPSGKWFGERPWYIDKPSFYIDGEMLIVLEVNSWESIDVAPYRESTDEGF